MPRPVAICTLIAGILAGLACMPLAGETQLVLQTNPFERPIVQEKPATVAAKAQQSAALALQLRATMLAGADSLANISGMIIGIGEEIEGYRLVTVRERDVILSKNGTTRTLSVDD